MPALVMSIWLPETQSEAIEEAKPDREEPNATPSILNAEPPNAPVIPPKHMSSISCVGSIYPFDEACVIIEVVPERVIPTIELVKTTAALPPVATVIAAMAVIATTDRAITAKAFQLIFPLQSVSLIGLLKQ